MKSHAIKSSYTIIQRNNLDSGVMQTLSPVSVNYNTITKWIQLCRQGHVPRCNPSSSPLPEGFQLIDCKTRKVVKADTMSTTPEYIALSYLWGRSSWFTLSKSNNFSNISKLPQVIEDAISVTLGIGFRFLWVDRYCIPEDSHASKMAQIYSMDAIYSRAQATVIAAVGKDPSVGLPGVGAKRFSQPTAQAQDRTFIWSMSPCSDLIEISLWNSRGW